MHHNLKYELIEKMHIFSVSPTNGMGMYLNNRKQNTIVIVSIVTCCYKIDLQDVVFWRKIVTEFQAYELPGNEKKTTIM
jgi:hypothetical protein